MAAARLSPTANLLRKSRLFAIPQALTPPQEAPTSRAIAESDTATLPYPIRASLVTPSSSLARGDWGLKRPLPAKSTSDKSSRPIVRVLELDTFEHTTDFESAADHTVTLEKFQELHMPMSLPSKASYAASMVSKHVSPFESHLDNTNTSPGLGEPGAKQFRHSGPWLAGQTETEFQAFSKYVQKNKPELLKKLRESFVAKRTAEQWKQAQDNGENLENLEPVKVTDEEFQAYIKSLRADPLALGPVVFELLDLPSAPAVPSNKIGTKYYQSPGTKLSAAEYTAFGPPKTHPSAGLSYTRSHALIYNHPKYGPQAFQRPVEARVLRPKGRFKGRSSGKAVTGVGGIAVDESTMHTFIEKGSSAANAVFDSSIPGGAKFWVNPVRSSVDSEGRIELKANRASATAKAPYGIDQNDFSPLSISDIIRGDHRVVPKMDRQPSGDIAKNLIDSLTKPNKIRHAYKSRAVPRQS
ncbi:hypothetical protein BO70DRAFT_364598 [Aspergillus heteromorphus CBS 117.55]|uniref:Mitochondrial ribosomal protein MRP51 n=1 Tax=Aspergillus heteromorphus CBS 117.55 TaxID=1448321 RepID=A0A317VL77_9EURO|nr:uncharacterized protein BO70DRAFT_364598 [Aspergillus heteromorphus CBS 117.55]PWY73688.1 hypothetical protein BO70DRAFT_364598 [Aspergillus heteromorphus CBS 117.55]